MENSINKLIAEYEKKIEIEDLLFKEVKRDIHEKKLALEDYSDLRHEQHIITARRQAYIQAKYDFDSLLDNI